ncbi:MAG TPA: host attachment protein [Dongiaceae bacterium]|jgi:protein required for attachment to host cells|nr:host attachment protein [Dongiaceae bacterium]
MKKTVTYILVADGARARLYVNQGVGKGLQPVSGATHKADLHHHDRDILTDKPGRAYNSVGTGRSAIEPHTEWHRFEKHKFAREMAKVLDAAAASKSFDRLILVAPPATLGDLRMELGDATRKMVTAELAKDLTRHAEQELPQHLGGVLAV